MYEVFAFYIKNNQIFIYRLISILKKTNIANKKAKKVEKEVAKEVVSKLTPKEEASLEAKGKSDRAPIDMDNIRERSRKGDRLATIERLKRLSQ